MTITLTKSDQRHRISLLKNKASIITVKAQWIDNGDGKDNDDLDLRAAILLPNGEMHLLDCNHQGSLSEKPFARHLGDVTSASIDKPGEEIIEVSPDIAKKLGGRIGIVFSVYSAYSNGAVSIASLQPKMRLEFGDDVVECHTQSIKPGKDGGIYTYVIGTAVIDTDGVSIQPSGLTSVPGSEATPWISWNGDSLSVEVTGPAAIKGGWLTNKLFNLGNKKRYCNL